MKKIKSISLIIIPVAMALIIIASVLANVLTLGKYDNILEQFFGSTPSYLKGDTKDADTQYVKSSFDSPKSLYEYEEELCAEIAQEGVTLLKNDGLLPLAKGSKLSLFSHSSVDLVSGGSGSGSGSFELTADLKTGLEAAGLSVNSALWNFYKSGKGSSYKRGPGVINYGAALDWSINECPLSVIRSDSGVVSSFAGTTAMFVLSRTGGEGGDEARDMAAYGGKAGSHYLEPDETELEIIKYLDENFDNIILLVNCNNAPELGWVKDYPNIKAVLNFPGAGRTGVYGLGRVLTGLDKDGKEISPSGHLVDTFAYDSFSSPAMQNMGDYRYENSDYYYVNYAEGVYVGYKYYETRYEDVVTGRANTGVYDYNSVVQYPFGYGMSYTDFTWDNFEVSQPDENGEITVTVTVRNTGLDGVKRRGKDVVQIYVQSPYTEYDEEYGVEKAAVSLVGFAKTDYIEPDGEYEATVKINLKDFVSYDANNEKTYILESGRYYITAAPDAHTAVNNVLAARSEQGDNKVDLSKLSGTGNSSLVGSYVCNSTDKTTYSTYNNGDEQVKITNQFDGCTAEGAKYLSRSNWSVMENNGLRYGYASQADSGAEIGGKQWAHAISSELKAKLDSRSSLNPAEGTAPTKYQFGEKNGVDLIDLRGADFDDPLWDELLSELTIPELNKLIDECGYCSPAAKSINKPKVSDLDGPAGLNKVVGHGSLPIGDNYYAMTWPTEYMLASTWNEDLAVKMGEGVGEDGLFGGVVGWYGPGMNIHRTPFAGRNFEYYSEDSFISGVLGAAEVQGAARKGMYSFIKHFALNDQETHRDHLGLVTWSGEQAIREIYLKPFEMCIKDNTVEMKYNEPVKDENGEIVSYTMKTREMPAATAVMSSFNRIGATWAGGNYNLITGVLRKEWGFNGFVLTDYEVPSYMDTRQTIAAGGDAKLKTVDMTNLFATTFTLAGDTEYQGYAREAAHRLLYTVVNSAGMNGFVHGVRFVNGFAYYKIMVIVWDVLAAGGLAALGFLLYKKIKKIRAEKTE